MREAVYECVLCVCVLSFCAYVVRCVPTHVLNLFICVVVCSATPQCTVGYGDVLATNDAERQFICAVLLLTALVYAVIFGDLAVQIAQMDKVTSPLLMVLRCAVLDVLL